MQLHVSFDHFSLIDTLTIAQEMAIVEASNVWGLLRGLETFSQLIYINEQNYVCSLRIFYHSMSLLLFMLCLFFIGNDQ
jgi:hypothetical protein